VYHTSQWVTETLETTADGKACGDGIKTRTVSCLHIATGDFVAETNCCPTEDNPKPSATEGYTAEHACETFAFEVTGSWQTCNAVCGGNGTQSRDVLCMSSAGYEVTASAYCNMDDFAALATQTCTTDCGETTAAAGRRLQSNTASWKAGLFGACSSTCGGGTWTREVTCTQFNAASTQYVTVDDANCDAAAKPATSEACNIFACPTYAWSYGEWSTCPVCGSGIQERSERCFKEVDGGDDTPVVKSLCNSGARLATSQACTGLAECITEQANATSSAIHIAMSPVEALSLTVAIKATIASRVGVDADNVLISGISAGTTASSGRRRLDESTTTIAFDILESDADTVATGLGGTFGAAVADALESQGWPLTEEDLGLTTDTPTDGLIGVLAAKPPPAPEDNTPASDDDDDEDSAPLAAATFTSMAIAVMSYVLFV